MAQLVLCTLSPIPGPPVWLGQLSSSLGRAHAGLALPTGHLSSDWGGGKPREQMLYSLVLG